MYELQQLPYFFALPFIDLRSLVKVSETFKTDCLEQLVDAFDDQLDPDIESSDIILKSHVLNGRTKLTFIYMIICLLGLGRGLDNGVGLTPQMGWNSWNKFGCNISQQLIIGIADKIITLGLHLKGYTYINLDDCWQAQRNSTTKEIIPDKRFPSGIKALVQAIHAKGLKLGLYSDSGYKTCQGRPGSFGHEAIDAQTYAKWGVDYLKYDNCFTNQQPPYLRFKRMSQALNKTGRPIFFSMCEWGVDDPWLWARPLANSWRTTLDIKDSFQSMVRILDRQKQLYRHAGPGGWNDPDMLQVGNGGMTTVQYQSHFALWAILKAPLLIGCDLTNITKQNLDILSNQEVIAINQDKLGRQAHLAKETQGLRGSVQLWVSALSDGSVAALIFNRDIKLNKFQIDVVGDLNLSVPVLVRDVINRQQVGHYAQRLIRIESVQSHGVRMLRVWPEKKVD